MPSQFTLFIPSRFIYFVGENQPAQPEVKGETSVEQALVQKYPDLKTIDTPEKAKDAIFKATDIAMSDMGRDAGLMGDMEIDQKLQAEWSKVLIGLGKLRKEYMEQKVDAAGQDFEKLLDDYFNQVEAIVGSIESNDLKVASQKQGTFEKQVGLSEKAKPLIETGKNQDKPVESTIEIKKSVDAAPIRNPEGTKTNLVSEQPKKTTASFEDIGKDVKDIFTDLRRELAELKKQDPSLFIDDKWLTALDVVCTETLSFGNPFSKDGKPSIKVPLITDKKYPGKEYMKEEMRKALEKAKLLTKNRDMDKDKRLDEDTLQKIPDIERKHNLKFAYSENTSLILDQKTERIDQNDLLKAKQDESLPDPVKSLINQELAYRRENPDKGKDLPEKKKYQAPTKEELAISESPKILQERLNKVVQTVNEIFKTSYPIIVSEGLWPYYDFKPPFTKDAEKIYLFDQGEFKKEADIASALTDKTLTQFLIKNLDCKPETAAEYLAFLKEIGFANLASLQKNVTVNQNDQKLILTADLSQMSLAQKDALNKSPLLSLFKPESQTEIKKNLTNIKQSLNEKYDWLLAAKSDLEKEGKVKDKGITIKPQKSDYDFGVTLYDKDGKVFSEITVATKGVLEKEFKNGELDLKFEAVRDKMKQVILDRIPEENKTTQP